MEWGWNVDGMRMEWGWDGDVDVDGMGDDLWMIWGRNGDGNKVSLWPQSAKTDLLDW